MPKRRKKKFIDKNNATTFQLVHRSQKDPLAADEDAPQRVLLPPSDDWTPGRKDNDRPELPSERESRISKQREYGIAFDDEYDYFQHLKNVTETEESVLVKNDDVSRTDYAIDNGNENSHDFKSKKVTFNFPQEVFASAQEEEIGMLHRAIPPVGPQVDWDPDVVAAMDEDFNYENPDNFLEDDFLKLASSGTNKDDDKDEESDYDSEEFDSEENYNGSISSNDICYDHDFAEEETKSRFTNYSMTSSVLPRTKHFETLDDQFEKFYEVYDDEKIGDLGHEDIDGNFDVDNVSESQDLQLILGLNKAKYQANEVDKVGKEFFENIPDAESSDSNDELVRVEKEVPDKKWDCESIISTYSNIYNHPKIIDIPKPIRLSKTGIPLNTLNTKNSLTMKELKKFDRENEKNENELSGTEQDSNITMNNIRRKDETKEEKLARKRAVKAARKERRMEKKATKTAFNQEKLRQNKEILNVQNNLNGIRIA